jgi:hypothetical protein
VDAGAEHTEEETMIKVHLRSALRSVCAAGLLVGLSVSLPAVTAAQETIDLSSLASAQEPPAFDNPESAVEAFKASLQKTDTDDLSKLLGLNAQKVAADENAKETFEALREGAARAVTLQGGEFRKLVLIGDRLWPLPFPLVKGTDGKWYFDTFDGIEEIVNRRVGENELEAIATVRAYIEAQEDYASVDRDDDGVVEFAQKLISSDGAADGLYWPTDEAHGESPAGDSIDQEELDDARKGEGYFGYHFRPLTAQGDNIAGGAYDYIINGNMVAGFGLIAWPAKYGETGVKTFVVNQNGIVYEADLGAATAEIVKYIDRFNPDAAWNIVND